MNGAAHQEQVTMVNVHTEKQSPKHTAETVLKGERHLAGLAQRLSVNP